jgi:Ankyrin repeats (many copies)/Ankyrin repeat
MICSIYEDFSPSEFVTEYGLFVWIPLTLGYSTFFGYCVFVNSRNPFSDKEINRLKATICVVVFIVISLYLIKTTTIYGVPALLNRVAGEPYQAQTIVTGKFWNTTLGPRLYLANYKTGGDGNVGSEKSLWKEVNRADIVAVSGIQSIWGQSIDTLAKLQASDSKNVPVPAKAVMEPTARTSAAKSRPYNPSSDEALLSEVQNRGGGKLVDVEVHLNGLANPNARAKDGKTALEHAAMNGNVQIVELLLKWGANIHLKDEQGDTTFFTACAFGNLDIAELLAEKGANIDEPNIYGTTPLIIASLTGRTSVVKFLLDKGANVDTRDGLGNTPLLAAKKKALKPQPEIMKLLEERGAKE